APGFHANTPFPYTTLFRSSDPTPLTPPTDTRKWTGIAAKADGLSVVGLPSDFDIEVNNLSVLFNTKSGNNGAATPVAAAAIDWRTGRAPACTPVTTRSGIP